MNPAQSYTVTFAHGVTTYHGSYEDACAAVRAVHPDASIGHGGDLLDGGDSTLCWPSEEAAQDGTDVRAVAKIRAGWNRDDGSTP